MKKICVIGLGYIGLPLSVVLALNDHSVIGVDVNEDIINKLNHGQKYIDEPTIESLTKTQVKCGNIIAKTIPEEADAFIIAVPTPKKKDNSCDLSYVVSGVKSICPFIKKSNLIVIESTVSPGVTNEIIKPLLEQSGFTVGKDIFLAHCPERVLPGNILHELVQNNRIVGGVTPYCAEKAMKLYQGFTKGKILITDSNTAEMSKLVENTFRDVNIALANELVKICNHLHIDALKVISLANEHPRVNIHQPGPGVGGHCLAIDPYFIIEKAPHLTTMISNAREINCSMPHYIISQVKALCGNTKHPKVGILGISYKGNVNDIRESPALEIIRLLKSMNIEIAVYDPYAHCPGLSICSLEEVFENADILLILVDHTEFKELEYVSLAKKMNHPLIFDTKNILNVEEYYNTDIQLLNLGNLFQIIHQT